MYQSFPDDDDVGQNQQPRHIRADNDEVEEGGAVGGQVISSSSSITIPYPQTAADQQHHQHRTTSSQSRRHLVHANDPERNGGTRLCNRITNTKYTLLTFVPKSILEQFSTFIPKYFLLLAVLQLWALITPVNPMSTWIPFLIVLGVGMAREGIDDYFRYQRDRLANERKCVAIRNGVKTMVQAQNILLGEVVYVENGEEIPADMVILKSPHKLGSVFLETTNLDGETNLKELQAVDRTMPLLEPDLGALHALVDCPTPNSNFYEFESSIRITDLLGEEEYIPLSEKQLLLQGAYLRNTEWAYGLVVYTGNHTKLGMNKHSPTIKWTISDLRIDSFSKVIFVVQLVLALIFGGLFGNLWQSSVGQRSFYLALDAVAASWIWRLILKWIVLPVRFLLLMSLMIPVSLKVTLELCKYIYALFIGWDLQMYDAASNTRAYASNTNTAEDLGHIDLVLCDKTGTLTENIMTLRRCSINERYYGNTLETVLDPTESSSQPLYSLQDDQMIMNDVERRDPHVLDFLRAITLCNTVSPVEDGRGRVNYHATSVDEVALVRGASSVGVVLAHREDHIVEISIRGSYERYQILNVLHFTPERRRMTVILRPLPLTNDGSQSGPQQQQQQQPFSERIIVICKGADDVIMERLLQQSGSSSSLVETTLRHCSEFATQGLRTLLVGMHVLEGESGLELYRQWNATTFAHAMQVATNRDSALDDAFYEMECSISLLGATAIEDHLQDGVSETISALREAGILVWMLTGDKLETAVQVATACNLVDTSEPHGKLLHVEGADALQIGVSLRRILEEIKRRRAQNQDVSIVIEGHVLTLALQYDEELFCQLAQHANSVICCRVTPHLKAELVRLMKSAPKLVIENPATPTTANNRSTGGISQIARTALSASRVPSHLCCLAIGDGGNDVAMLLEANVGVGISGKEGLQAARAADYVIGRFRFLRRLIMVHGRLATYRSAFIAQYSFYKSMLIAFCQLLFALRSAFSGGSLFNAYSLITYNMLFTGILPLGFIFDKDVSESSMERIPALYSETREGLFLNRTSFLFWAVRAVYHAIVVFVPLLMYGGSESTAGDYTDLGMASFTAILVIQSFTILFESNYLTKLNIAAIVGSFVVYGLLTLIVQFSAVGVSSDMYDVAFRLLSDPRFYGYLLLTVVLAILPVLAVRYYRFSTHPSLADSVREKESIFRHKNRGLSRLPSNRAYGANPFLVDIENQSRGVSGFQGGEPASNEQNANWATASNMLIAMPRFENESRIWDSQQSSTTFRSALSTRSSSYLGDSMALPNIITEGVSQILFPRNDHDYELLESPPFADDDRE